MKSHQWVISDTHFGHHMLVKKRHRPDGYEDAILSNLSVIGENDILFHLGDVSLYDSKYWHEEFLSHSKAKRNILILGNHDRNTKGWHYDRGWDCVCDEMVLNVFGKKITLTHIPMPTNIFVTNIDLCINVHGHVHNTNHRKAHLTDNHKAVIMEHEYRPLLLKKMVNM